MKWLLNLIRSLVEYRGENQPPQLSEVDYILYRIENANPKDGPITLTIVRKDNKDERA